MTGEWVNAALCARHPYDPALWDYEIHGETYRQRTNRITVALEVCGRCPVQGRCDAETNPLRDEGVRAARLLPGLRMQAESRAAA